MKKRVRRWLILLCLFFLAVPSRFVSAAPEIFIPQSVLEDKEIKDICGVSEAKVYFKDNDELLFAFDRKNHSLTLLQELKGMDFSATYPTAQGLFWVTLSKQGALKVQYDEGSEHETLYEKKNGVTPFPAASLDSDGILYLCVHAAAGENGKYQFYRTSVLAFDPKAKPRSIKETADKARLIRVQNYALCEDYIYGRKIVDIATDGKQLLLKWVEAQNGTFNEAKCGRLERFVPQADHPFAAFVSIDVPVLDDKIGLSGDPSMLPKATYRYEKTKDGYEISLIDMDRQTTETLGALR